MIAMEKVRRYMESLDLTVAVEVLEGHMDEAASRHNPVNPGLLPAAGGSWQTEETGPHSLHAQAVGHPQLHAQVSLSLARRARQDSRTHRPRPLTLKTAAFPAPSRTSTSASSHP